MKVLFVTQYGALAASSRTRVFQYLPYLVQCGVESSVITVLPDRAIAGSQIVVTDNPLGKLRYYAWALWRTLSSGILAWWRARPADVLFIQKVIFPRPVRWLLRRCRCPVVYDFDDAIFTTEVRETRSWLAAWKERRNATGLPGMLKLAAVAVVENEYNADFARSYCEVATITGPIDTELYQMSDRVSDRVSDRARNRSGCKDEGVVLGWIGSATSRQYLELLRGPLGRLSRRFPQLKLHVVGAESPQVEGLRVESKDWNLEEEGEDLRGFDIGLMPISDDPWTRGKGGYKLLQYMATGLPVVTSPVGINRQIVRDGESGFWARSPGEWEERLALLIESPELRQEMGRRGRATVEEKYALGVQQERFLGILRGVCSSERASL